MCTNETQHWMEHANDLFTLLCGVTTVLLNALVLYIALRYVEFHVKLNQIYVVNMTISDLLYGTVYMSTKPLVACFPDWLCACYYVMVWSSQIGSVFFLLFLNVDKFISLSAPLHYHIYVTEKRVRWLWIAFWAVPLSYSILTYFGPWIVFPDSKIPCKIGLHPIYYASTIITFYILPLTISASISVYIYLLAHKKTRWIAQSPEHQSGERKRARKQMLKRVFFVFSSTLWSTITILPYRFAYCIYTFACVTGSYSTSSGRTSHSINVSSTIPSEGQAFTISPTANWSFTSASTYVTTGVQENVPRSGWSMCNSETISVLIYILFCLPPLGAVGNPIITIVTQRFYRRRAAEIWISCLKLLHAPKCFEFKQCGGTLDNANSRFTVSSTNETKLMEDAKCQKYSDASVAVPLMVMRRRGSKGETVETVLANKTFQVL